MSEKWRIDLNRYDKHYRVYEEGEHGAPVINALFHGEGPRGLAVATRIVRCHNFHDDLVTVLDEFISDIEIVGAGLLERDWPDLLVTYKHAQALRERLRKRIPVKEGVAQEALNAAAQKAARTGKREDLQEYLKMRCGDESNQKGENP